MNDSEKIQFDDEFISKRLKDKNRSSAVLYVFAAILILLAVVLLVMYSEAVRVMMQPVHLTCARKQWHTPRMSASVTVP